MNYSRLVLSGVYRETGILTKGLASAAGKEGFRFDHFYLKVEALKRNKNVKKIIIECSHDFSVRIFAGLEEIRERIVTLVSSGKEVYFYSAAYGVQELFLSAACSYRLIHPMGTVRFFGLSQSFTFAKRLMRRFGIDAEVIRRGKFKSAGDRFKTDRLEESNKEQYEHFLDSVMNIIQEGIKTGFEKNSDDLKELLDGRVLTADDAADASWIDEVVTFSEFINRWKEDKDKEHRFKKTPEKIRGGFSLKARKVAVLVFEGAVVDGHSRRDLLMGQAIGADSFIPQIRKLREDKKVKAVVLRINSGGGSAFASEDITAELRLLAKKKPLVVSMSEVAGSGGYWMSCCGRKTFALPTTLTGSIGVISIYLSWYRLLDKLGIKHDTIKNGEFADTGSPLRAVSEKEKAVIDSEIENMYRGFVRMTAEARNLSEEQVDLLGQGRVWPGCSAVQNKLVDEAGGLTTAIKSAAFEAGLKKPTVQFYPEVKHGLIERLIMNISKDDEETLKAAVVISGVTEIISKANLNTGPLALMEEVLLNWR